jgi:hypothetical protein
MLKFVEKLHLEKYVSSKLILGLDIFISIMMSVFALFLTELLFVSFSYEFLMLLGWLMKNQWGEGITVEQNEEPLPPLVRDALVDFIKAIAE